MTEPVETAEIHLPRSLAALFPGAPRRVEVRGATVAALFDDLELLVPGIRNRLLDSGPSLRTHINVYVSGERAGLDTPVAPGAAVYIVPAVSGG